MISRASNELRPLAAGCSEAGPLMRPLLKPAASTLATFFGLRPSPFASAPPAVPAASLFGSREPIGSGAVTNSRYCRSRRGELSLAPCGRESATD